MDLLYKSIKNEGDAVYFIASPIEEPYHYIRLYGIIKEISVYNETLTYRIKVENVFETTDTIKTYFCNNHYRVKSIKNKQSPYIDYYIRRYIGDDVLLINILVDRLTNKWFDVSSMLTFDTLEECNEILEKINKVNIDKLVGRVEWLSKRNLTL